VLTVASRGPALVLSSVGGELAQRHDPRRLAIALALLQVVPPALLAVIAWLDPNTELIIYALVLAGGILSSLALAPTTWISSHSVPQELMRKAIGESSVAYNIAASLARSPPAGSSPQSDRRRASPSTPVPMG
jgi:predicted MFS family arabinose efflux permease